MKKVFDQTVRDIKREVNKKVLKVPGIEQKVLDATSNEPWGPHGTLLSDIAHATRNYHEHQMIMSIIWKRLSDTGKNWRHVYKGLTVLEYLVAHGSERVIDDIREHAYQISALAEFQYIDSSGRDQGNNVRRKSQGLVVFVNDKERIVEVRQKAATNRDKFRTSPASGMHRSASYDDNNYGRYGSRDDDRNGYGREREWGSRDDDRYGRNGDSYGRDGDRYGRDGYKDNDYRGSSRSTDEYPHGSRSRSSERDRDRADDDDGRYSSRESGSQVGDQSQNGRVHEQKFSEQNTGAPPSYEEAVTESRSPVPNERDGDPASSSAARASPPISSSSTLEATISKNDASPVKQVVDEFDPRGSAVAPVSAPSSNVEMDLLGSLTDSYSSNVSALMPAPSSETDANRNFGSEPTYGTTASDSNVLNQAFEDPFGDAPFKAITSGDSGLPERQPSTSVAHFQPTMNQNAGHSQLGTPNGEAATKFGFGESFSATTYPTNSQLSPPESSIPQQDIDILADILPSSRPQPLVHSHTPFSSSTGHPAQPIANHNGGYQAPAGAMQAHHTQTGAMQAHPTQNLAGATFGSGNFHPVGGSTLPQYPTRSATQFNSGYLHQHQYQHQHPGSAICSQPTLQTMSGPVVPQAGPHTQMATHPLSTGSLSVVSQPSKEKFETKSTVWADTLSRGLVDLNISGSKINPLAEIGIDFAAINRREKRMEKPAATPITSTVTMGKAMGSGTGMGRAGATALRPAASNPMMGSGMGMGIGMGRGPSAGGMGMGGGYGVMSQPMGMGGGGYGGMSQPMGMGMNMRMGQGVPMQPPTGLPHGSAMPGSGGYNHNPMMGAGGYGYASQQPYGGYQ